jgi:hypothetical protein
VECTEGNRESERKRIGRDIRSETERKEDVEREGDAER